MIPLGTYILRGIDKEGTPLTFPLLSNSAVVGRQGDVLLRHASVSRHHALLERRGDDWLLTDTGSRNGTFANGASVQRHFVRPGDVLQFGHVKLKVEVVGAASPGGGDEAETNAATMTMTDASVLLGPTTALVGRSEALKSAMRLAVRAAKSDATVLVFGESGTGKELFARLIYEESLRRDRKFIAVNCSAIEQTLLGSTLFGHEKGAFTDARERRIGRAEAANGGTLFLDEIGELPLELQSTLLRVLQDGEVVRVGGSKSHKVNVRIISATNRSLEDMIASGRFRSDLFYRLNVVAIHVPPLRERREDIPGLAEKQIRHLNDKYNQSKIITANFINGLMTLEWPGNVRELNNFIEKQFVISGSDIIDSFGDSAAHEAQAHDFFQPQAASVQAAGRDAFGHQAPHAGPEGQAEDQPPSVTVDGIMPMADARRELEKILISRAMAKGGSTHKAAALLKMSQPTFFRRYKELFPDGGDWDEEA